MAAFVFSPAAVRSPARRAHGSSSCIAFLVLHARSGPIQRQRLAGSLWPESTDVQALTNLRRELHHLREGWPNLDALVDAGSRTLAWRGTPARSSTWWLSRPPPTADWRATARRSAKRQRSIAATCCPTCAGEWIDADRERLRQRAKQVLIAWSRLLEQERAFGDAIERAQQLLRLDPLDEQAWCALMRCHARRGERAAALHLYQQCAATLKKELGVQPSAATRLTYREILDLDAEAPRRSRRRRAPPSIRSSAVKRNGRRCSTPGAPPRPAGRGCS